MTVEANEWTLSEEPALLLLKHLNYTFVEPSDISNERDTESEPVLTSRLFEAIKKLNDWISDENAKRVVNELTRVPAVDTLDANEKIHSKIVSGVSVKQEKDGINKSHRVIIFDFDVIENNEFLVTNQYRVKGPLQQVIKPDIVVFINGIPIAVIECKSPLNADPLNDGLNQLIRYQDEGPQLFNYAHFVIAAWGDGAIFGTTDTPPPFYTPWKDPFPLTFPEYYASLEAIELRKASDDIIAGQYSQHLLIQGIFNPENVLDLIQNFIVFETSDNNTVKKIARYQQFRATNKVYNQIINLQDKKFLETLKKEEEKNQGGIVWHTQGSGKSLTMVFLATKLRRESSLENPTLMIVTDRTDLDDQIFRTFKHCKFPNPDSAESISDLHDLISSSTGRTILTTIHKFQHESKADREAKLPFYELSNKRNIILLVDEAHRTQYGGLGSNMQTALPNAILVGFTGTPIDKQDRSTPNTFGPYADVYSIEQSVQDNSTVPIYYESRLADLHIIGKDIDKAFDEAFANYSKEARDKIIREKTRMIALMENEARIEDIAKDILQHYQEKIEQDGMKAQIVAVSREAAVLYHLAFRKLRGLNKVPEKFLDSLIKEQNKIKIKVEESKRKIESNKDSAKKDKYKKELEKNESKHSELTNAIRIVEEMIEKDKAEIGKFDPSIPLTEVIYSGGRTNETTIALDFYKKSKNWVNDSIKNFKKDFPRDAENGLADHSNEVKILIVCDMLLTGFDAPVEQVMYLDKPLKEHNLLQAIARVNRKYMEIKDYGLIVDYFGLQKSLKEALAVFHEKDIEHTLIPINDILPEIEMYRKECLKPFLEYDITVHIKAKEALLQEPVRKKFADDFKGFTKALDLLLPRKEAQPYLSDLKHLGVIYKLAKSSYDGHTVITAGYKSKIRKIINEHVSSLGITQLTKPISILDPEFYEKLKVRSQSVRGQAKEMEHSIKHILRILIRKDEAYTKKMAERLEELIERYEDRRIDDKEFYDGLKILREEIYNRDLIAKQLGLTPIEFPFYNLLADVIEEEKEIQNSVIVEFAKKVVSVLNSKKVRDWFKPNRIDAQRQMKIEVLKAIWDSGLIDSKNEDTVTLDIMNLAREHLK